MSRARAAEQKQLADGEKLRADKTEEDVSGFLSPAIDVVLRLTCASEQNASERT